MLLYKSSKDKNLTLFKYFVTQVLDNQYPLSAAITLQHLGGALSVGVIALTLIDNSQEDFSLDESNEWDSKLKFGILAISTAAGSTFAGDSTRCDRTNINYHDSRIEDKTDQIWNAFDIIPYAWRTSMLIKIPNIYEPIYNWLVSP